MDSAASSRAGSAQNARFDDRNRQMVAILSAVLEDGLLAVEAAPLEGGVLVDFARLGGLAHRQRLIERPGKAEPALLLAQPCQTCGVTFMDLISLTKS